MEQIHKDIIKSAETIIILPSTVMSDDNYFKYAEDVRQMNPVAKIYLGMDNMYPITTETICDCIDFPAFFKEVHSEIKSEKEYSEFYKKLDETFESLENPQYFRYAYYPEELWPYIKFTEDLEFGDSYPLKYAPDINFKTVVVLGDSYEKLNHSQELLLMFSPKNIIYINTKK